LHGCLLCAFLKNGVREGGCRERASRPSTAAYNTVVPALSAQTNLLAIDCTRRDDISYFAEHWPVADERIPFSEVTKAAAYSAVAQRRTHLVAWGVYFLQRQGEKKENSKMLLQTIAIVRFKN
jgi:hypothetical protein